MASRCSPLLLPLLNEVFGTHYTGEETIRFHPNEFFTDRPGGKQEEYITDTYFDVLQGDGGADAPHGVADGRGCPPGRKHRYHLECQSTADRTILVRIFQYDVLIALEGGELEGNTFHVTFPRSAVLYLRGSGGTPDTLRLYLHTAGGDVTYPVPVIKLQSYTMEELFEKELYFLLPFVLFLYEKELPACNTDAEKRDRLKQCFVRMRERLEELTVQGKITEQTKWMILEMTQKVVTNLARKQENVAREVNHTMRGPIIMTESSRIFDSGVLVGERRGEQRGICNSITIAMSMGAKINEAIQRVAGQYKMNINDVKEIWEKRSE